MSRRAMRDAGREPDWLDGAARALELYCLLLIALAMTAGALGLAWACLGW